MYRRTPPATAECRMGFHLLETCQTCFGWPDVAYRGINRVTCAPLGYFEVDELRERGEDRLADLWDEYYDAEDYGQLQKDVQVARKLQRDFLTEGIELEVIYIEISHIPEHLDQYPSAKLWKEQLADALKLLREKEVTARPGELLDFLGYDVSTLHAAFHSAIFQPGLRDTYPALRRLLNENGLLDDIDEAKRFLEAMNVQDYGPLPFCIMAVWEA